MCDDYKIGNLMFDMLLEQEILIDEIKKCRQKLQDEQQKRVDYEADLWLHTDFKALKLTNKEQRDVYVKKMMKDYISKENTLKIELKRKEMRVSFLSQALSILMTFDKEDSVHKWRDNSE